MLKFITKISLTMKNISKEDYLSVIYKNRDEDGKIKANVIAGKLSVSGAAVTDMLKKLSKDGYIKYERYKGITLTQGGEDYARNMVRRHRIWEVFLHQVVGMPWGKVHDEANNLEHSGSDELINRMEEMLHFPEFDPHGDPIPNREGQMPKRRKEVPVSGLKIGQTGTVVRVNDLSGKFLSYLSELGIRINAQITAKEKREFDKSMNVIVKDKQWNISGKIAENVFVEINKKKE